MRPKLWMFILLCCTCSCSTLQKDQTKEKSMHTDNSSYVSTSLSEQRQQLLWQDSVGTMTEIALWPSGKFNLTKEGFEGEASKVFIKATTSQQSFRLAKQSGTIQSTAKAELRKKDFTRHTQKQVRRKGISFWYGFIPLVLLLLIGCYYWRKRISLV